jgi:hypothetical protein
MSANSRHLVAAIAGKEKTTGEARPDGEKMTEWPSRRGPITKIMASDGCQGIQFPRRWDISKIPTKLDVIRGMSVK